jgi:hypothetical protein
MMKSSAGRSLAKLVHYVSFKPQSINCSKLNRKHHFRAHLQRSVRRARGQPLGGETIPMAATHHQKDLESNANMEVSRLQVVFHMLKH